MKVSEIVTRVRAAIDELTQNDSDFLGQSKDELNLTDVIKDKIDYALQWVIENAPLDRIDSGLFETLTAGALASDFSIDAVSKVATLKLPDSLIRIVEARLSSWFQFPIPEPDTSQVALMQQDQWARGSWDRPVNILTYDKATGRQILNMYCAKEAEGANKDTLVFAYIGKPSVPEATTEAPDPEVGVPSRLEASFIYQVAGLSMVAFREDIAASLLSLSKDYLGRNDG